MRFELEIGVPSTGSAWKPNPPLPCPPWRRRCLPGEFSSSEGTYLPQGLPQGEPQGTTSGIHTHTRLCQQ